MDRELSSPIPDEYHDDDIPESNGVRNEYETLELMETAPDECFTHDEIILISRNISRGWKLLDGRTGAKYMKIEGGGAGIFKPYLNETEADRVLNIHNERASYVVSVLLDFDIVPPTVIRPFKDNMGSFQQYIEGVKTDEEVFREQLPEQELVKLGIFDYIINNEDRTGGNFLFDEPIGKIYAGDNGKAFSRKRDAVEEFTMRGILDTKIDDIIIGNISRTAADIGQPSEQVSELRRLVAAQDLDSMFRRIQQLDAVLKRQNYINKAVIDDLR